MSARDSNNYTITTQPTGKSIGTTTIGATGGTAVAGSVAVVLVWALSLTGLVVPAEVTAAMTVILAAVGALVGGKFTPSNQVRTETQVVVAPDVVDNVVPPFPGTPGADSVTPQGLDPSGSHSA